jgi:hypothetical protein
MNAYLEFWLSKASRLILDFDGDSVFSGDTYGDTFPRNLVRFIAIRCKACSLRK